MSPLCRRYYSDRVEAGGSLASSSPPSGYDVAASSQYAVSDQTARARFPQSPWFPRAQGTSATRTSITVAGTCCWPSSFDSVLSRLMSSNVHIKARTCSVKANDDKWFIFFLVIKRPRSVMFNDFPLLLPSVNTSRKLFCFVALYRKYLHGVFCNLAAKVHTFILWNRGVDPVIENVTRITAHWPLWQQIFLIYQ